MQKGIIMDKAYRNLKLAIFGQIGFALIVLIFDFSYANSAIPIDIGKLFSIMSPASTVGSFLLAFGIETAIYFNAYMKAVQKLAAHGDVLKGE